MKPVLRLLLLTLAAFLSSLFASPEAEAVGWKTAPDDEVRQHGDGQHEYAGPEAEWKGEKRRVPDGKRAEQFFSETLEDAGENGPSAREQCRMNGWLNYDTTSGCTVAARNISNPGPSGFVLVGEGSLHSTVAVRQGSLVNRVFDSGFATNSRAAQLLGRYFGEGGALPSTASGAITNRGLNLPGIINNAQLGAVYRANTHLPALRGPAAGGTGTELIINPSNFRHLQLQGGYVPIAP